MFASAVNAVVDGVNVVVYLAVSEIRISSIYPTKSLEEVLENCKILFIGCAHDEYKNLNLDDSYKTIDCWGML